MPIAAAQKARKIIEARRQAQRVIEACRDPEWFIDSILGKEAYSKQIDMCDAVMSDEPRISVVGCNGSGKDWCTGSVIIPQWMRTRWPAKVVVIGPTHRQVSDIVFNELRGAFKSARYPLGGIMYDGASKWFTDEENFVVGFATTDSFNIQGYHSPNLLVIVTEAHNVPEEHFEAINSLNPACILLTGNPLSASGTFYESFHAQTHRWDSIQISAFDTPNVIEEREVIPGLVTAQDVRDRREEYGEESPIYISRVLGQFPDNLEDAIVPRSLLMSACERDLEFESMYERASIACDVARFGADTTCVYKRRGGVCRLIWKINGRDTQQVAGKLIALVQEDETIDTIIVDDNGVGGGVTDRLREERPRGGRVNIVAFNGGSSASDKSTYSNAVTEAWYGIREAAIAGILDLGEDSATISQLSSRKFKYLGSGLVQLEPKEDYKKRVGGSPDEADALAMLFSPLSRKLSAGLFGTGNKASSWAREEVTTKW